MASILTPPEFELWSAQPRYDLRHTLGVARRAEALLGAAAEPRWLAAALLHDVGKVRAHLGIFGRVTATLLMIGIGRARVASWHSWSGIRGRFGRYAVHGPAGADLIQQAGGRNEVATWADAHHRVRRGQALSLPGIPQSVAIALREADRD
ncbi:MAG: HD domain-containing protein [Actinobacteria bacterium]|nr:HD domain-containing protein [Actinomycetota bacterium]